MQEPDNGSQRSVDGADYVYYNGYWVRYYKPLEESLASRKTLIDNLTRRAFHHTEPGINTPGVFATTLIREIATVSEPVR